MMVNNSDDELLKLVSYNSRGFNESTQQYLHQLLSECDILFLQEHWLTETQVHDLSSFYVTHLACGVSGFGNDEVLSGRPYGGCALFWRSSLSVTPVKVVTLSQRICALLLEGTGFKLLCVCVYLPYEKGSDNVDEFLYQLSVVESVMSQFPDCHVIIGGGISTLTLAV